MKKSKVVTEGATSRRALLNLALVFALTGLPAQPKAAGIAAVKKSQRTKRPEVYLLRGLANIFSTGLDEIGKSLQSAGVDAHVEAFTSYRWALEKIVADRRKYGAQPVILVGHSLGANAIIGLAEALDKRGIQVDYMASFAATNPHPLPKNVKRAVNFYFESRGWGRPLVAGPGFRGHLKNRDLSEDPNIDHFNIEKQPPLQHEVVRDILRVLR